MIICLSCTISGPFQSQLKSLCKCKREDLGQKKRQPKQYELHGGVMGDLVSKKDLSVFSTDSWDKSVHAVLLAIIMRQPHSNSSFPWNLPVDASTVHKAIELVKPGSDHSTVIQNLIEMNIIEAIGTYLYQEAYPGLIHYCIPEGLSAKRLQYAKVYLLK